METKTVLQVAKTARDVRDYIKDTGILPTDITFTDDGSQVNQATFLRMMSIAIALIETNNPSKILPTTFKNPPQEADQVTGNEWNKKDYTGTAFDTSNAMIQTGVTPTLHKTPYGYLSFYGIIWTFSRILGWYFENKKVLPNFAVIKNKFLKVPTIVKSQLWQALEGALGGQFNSAEELRNLLQNHPDYQYYYNDQKDQGAAVAALAVVGGVGNNCVDISQLIRQVLIDMGYSNVHIWRGTFNCGGHVWVTFGSNNTIFDGAGMMKYGIGFDQYMCSGTPWDMNKDPSWLLSDDGVT